MCVRINNGNVVKKKKTAAVKVLDGGDCSDYSTIEPMYVCR